MKTSTLLKSALTIVLATTIIFSCKKKDDTAPEETAPTTTGSTGGTTGGTTGGIVLGANQLIVSGGATYNFDTVRYGGFTASYPTYRQVGEIKNNAQFQLLIDLRGNTLPTAGTYNMSNGTSAGANEAFVNLTLPNPSGGIYSCTATSGTITSTISNSKLTSTFNNAVFVSGGWPIVTFTISASITTP